MPTSSITKDFVIKDPEVAKRFIEALEESEEDAKSRKKMFSHSSMLMFTPVKDKVFYDKLLAVLKECPLWNYFNEGLEPNTEYCVHLSISEMDKRTKALEE